MRTTEVVVTEFVPPSRFRFEATEKADTYRTMFQISPRGSGSRVERIVDPPTTGRGGVRAACRAGFGHPGVRA